MDYSHNMIRKFRERGLKITPQRLAIFNLLDGNTGHPTAEEIYSGLKKDFPNLSFTTVYNILKSIKEAGGIQELLIERERAHYDPDVSLHHHIICTRCGKLRDIFYTNTSEMRLPDDILKEFSVTGHQIHFYGVCRACSENEEEEEGKTAVPREGANAN